MNDYFHIKQAMPHQHWYAAKVFFNKVNPVEDYLKDNGVDYYIPMHYVECETEHGRDYKLVQLINSLMFILATDDELKSFQQQFYGKLMVYGNRETHRPYAIPNHEMNVFILVTSVEDKGLMYLGEDKPAYHVGSRVRVIDGMFKGAEGYIKRIHKDRRLIVSIEGIAAVATSYIHPSFLELIES